MFVMDDNEYQGMDLWGDPDLLLPPRAHWGDIGMAFIFYIILFFVFLRYLIFLWLSKEYMNFLLL